MSYKTPGQAASNQAAEIKRTESTLRKLATELAGISEGSRRTLLDAAAILAASGKDKKSAAAKLKAEEAETERKCKEAEAEALRILDTFPAADLADQIALCLAWQDRWNFEGEKRLREDLKGYTDFEGRHQGARRRDLENIRSDFRRAVSDEAGYLASRKGRPVAEFMATVREAFDAARQGETCRQLVEAWQAALVAEQLVNANKGALK